MEISNILNYALIGFVLFICLLIAITVLGALIVSVKVYRVEQEMKLRNKYSIHDELTPEEYKILKKLDKRG